jgi:PAS domain S-box-containing protein
MKRTENSIQEFPVQEYFQGVIDGLTEDLKIVDRDYRIVYVNQIASQKLFKEPGEILGQKCYEVFNHFDRPCPFCTTQKTFETGETLHTEFGYTDTEGDPYFFILTTYPLRDSEGGIPYVVEITRDVTQEKRLEQEVIKSRTLRAIGRFAAELAHEVRNPLNAISFQMALLRKVKESCADTACTDQISESLNIVNEEIARLTKITQDFLTFTRQESLKPVAVDLQEVVASAVEFLRGDLEKRGITVTQLPEGRSHRVLIDRDRFRQVLVNLLTNAMDALPEGGEITISLSTDGNGNKILTVSDTGPGIPRSLAEKIFDPFFSGKPKGTGLGLSIVKNIVEAHGGTISLEHSESGATFKITLPGVAQ